RPQLSLTHARSDAPRGSRERDCRGFLRLGLQGGLGRQAGHDGAPGGRRSVPNPQAFRAARARGGGFGDRASTQNWATSAGSVPSSDHASLNAFSTREGTPQPSRQLRRVSRRSRGPRAPSRPSQRAFVPTLLGTPTNDTSRARPLRSRTRG